MQTKSFVVVMRKALRSVQIIRIVLINLFRRFAMLLIRADSGKCSTEQPIFVGAETGNTIREQIGAEPGSRMAVLL